MPDVQTSPLDDQNNNQISSSYLSPRDEELPKEEAKKEVIGQLNDSLPSESGSPFNLPSEDIAPNATKPIATVSTSVPPQNEQKVLSETLPTEQPLDPVESNIGDGANLVPETSSILAVESNTDQAQPSQQPEGAPTLPPLPTGLDAIRTASRFGSGVESAQPPQESVMPMLDQTTSQVSDISPTASVQPQVVTDEVNQKKSLFSRFSFKKQASSSADANTSKPNKPVVLIVLFSAISLFVFMIALTEMAILSIGLENVYGKVGLELLWGGLSQNADQALVKSFTQMQTQPNFEVSGNMTLGVDPSIESDIVTPIILTRSDSFIAKSLQTAIFASLNKLSYEDDYYWYWDEDYDDSSDYEEVECLDDDCLNSDQSQTTTNQSTTTTLEQQTTGPSFLDYEDDSEETDQEVTSATVQNNQIKVDFTGLFSSSGNETELKIGQSDKIYLKNKDKKFYVKSNSFKFDQLAEDDKWLEYSFSKGSDLPVQEEIFTKGQDGEYFINGKRVGRERIDNVLTYKYTVSEMEIGNSLSALGVSASQIQKISGDFYIGVKDKLLRKVDLEVVLGTSTVITKINLSLNFKNYGNTESFISPSASEVIEVAEPKRALLDDVEEDDEDEAQVSGDDKRKADLLAIKQALNDYKGVTGSFPRSAQLTRLDRSGNVLESALVSSYLTALPTDPKQSLGWYYGYKSVDGKSFSLSSRLEDVNDADGQSIDGIVLYFVYN